VYIVGGCVSYVNVHLVEVQTRVSHMPCFVIPLFNPVRPTSFRKEGQNCVSLNPSPIPQPIPQQPSPQQPIPQPVPQPVPRPVLQPGESITYIARCRAPVAGQPSSTPFLIAVFGPVMTAR
jgi:hypothetical protein